MLKAILLLLALVLLSNQRYMNIDGDELTLTSFMPIEMIIQRLFKFDAEKIKVGVIEPYFHPREDQYVSIPVTPAKKRNYFGRARGNPGKLTYKCILEELLDKARAKGFSG